MGTFSNENTNQKLYIHKLQPINIYHLKATCHHKKTYPTNKTSNHSKTTTKKDTKTHYYGKKEKN